jgi:hypothetical protein
VSIDFFQHHQIIASSFQFRAVTCQNVITGATNYQKNKQKHNVQMQVEKLD